MSVLTQQYDIVRQNIPSDLCLVAVSKTKPVEMIQELYAHGVRHFGENKVQELVNKHEALPKDIQWHMIGHLQTNKVKYIAPFVSLIHSVDRLKLAKEINKEAQKTGRKIPCLIQVHIAEEQTKSGFSVQDIRSFIENRYDFADLEHIEVQGLMGMATFTNDTSQITAEFNLLKELYTAYQSVVPQLRTLSMGMSGDYPLAIQQGSNMIRVGSQIFGSR